MEDWEKAWLNCQTLPPSVFPQELVVVAQDSAELVLFDEQFRCTVEEWVSRSAAEEIMIGLLWNGFCLRGQELTKRVPPIPALSSVLYETPAASDPEQTLDRVVFHYRRAVDVWVKAFCRYRSNLRVSP